MKLNEYHDKAMSTNAESSDNIVYSLLGLNAEVGEINDKIAKWRRKGMANIDNNKLVFTTSSEVEATYLRNELLKEWAMYFGFAHIYPASLAQRSMRWRG